MLMHEVPFDRITDRWRTQYSTWVYKWIREELQRQLLSPHSEIGQSMYQAWNLVRCLESLIYDELCSCPVPKVPLQPKFQGTAVMKVRVFLGIWSLVSEHTCVHAASTAGCHVFWNNTT